MKSDGNPAPVPLAALVRLSSFAPFFAWVTWFDLAWLTAVAGFSLWGAVAAEWPIAVAMLFGSYVAGSTPMGGGTVGFPILVLLFGEDVSVGRTFSFMVQSVGMGSASIFLLCARRTIAWRLLLVSLATAAAVIPLSLWLLVPLVPDAIVKLTFATIWAGFGIMTLVKLRALLGQHGLPDLPARYDYACGVFIGVTGGLATALTGVGIDMILYTVLVLLYRCDLRIAIATSIVAMASCSLIGSVSAGSMGLLSMEVVYKWLAAAPVVLLGAPLGAVAVHYLPRGQTLTVVATLCLVQFAWTLWQLNGSALLAVGAVVAVLVLNVAFMVRYAWGGRLHRD